jgi:hypothetical protein
MPDFDKESLRDSGNENLCPKSRGGILSRSAPRSNVSLTGLGLARVRDVARKVEDLLGLQTEVRQSLQVIEQRLRALEDRMLTLEAGQGQVYHRGTQRSDGYGERGHFRCGDSHHAP